MFSNLKILCKLISICYISLQFNTVNAQVLDQAVLKNFDASIITKLYKIARCNLLSPQSQNYIANSLKITDSTTKAWLLQAKPIAQIDSLQKSSELMLFSLQHPTTAVNNLQISDSLNNISLVKDGYLLPLSQFTIALRCKEILKIDPAIIDSLVYYVMHMAARQDSMQRLEPFTWVDFGAYESFHLSKLLTEEQYTNLLLLKVKPDAIIAAKKDWAEMERRGMDKGLNKVYAISEIIDYYIKRYSGWSRLAHDSKLQMTNVRMLEETKPSSLKILDAARWNGEPENSDNNLKLQW